MYACGCACEPRAPWVLIKRLERKPESPPPVLSGSAMHWCVTPVSSFSSKMPRKPDLSNGNSCCGRHSLTTREAVFSIHFASRRAHRSSCVMFAEPRCGPFTSSAEERFLYLFPCLICVVKQPSLAFRRFFLLFSCFLHENSCEFCLNAKFIHTFSVQICKT